MKLRVKSLEGASFTVQLDPSSTAKELYSQVSSATGLVRHFKLKAGNPPKFYDIANNDMKLVDIGVRNGDTLLMSLAILIKEEVLNKEKQGQEQFAPQTQKMVVRVQKDDNSCLFNAIQYLLDPTASISSLRQSISQKIKADPLQFNEGILGRPVDDYCSWILQKNAWGGAIELLILATCYKTEIVSVDVVSGRFDRFGTEFSNVCYVVYSGIHYDALALSSGPEEFDERVFSMKNDVLETQVGKVVEELRKNHKYTDMANFTLKCGICGSGIKGEREAREHATITGHQSFTEYS